MAYLSLRLAVWGLGALGEFRVPAFGGSSPDGIRNITRYDQFLGTQSGSKTFITPI